MPENGPSLSMTPERFVCSVCGKTANSAAGWLSTPDGEHGVCPSCASLVQHNAEKQARDANLPRALLYGGTAGFVGGAFWYGLAATLDARFTVVAIGIGWLVGVAVVIGSGNKRSTTLQWISGTLAVAAMLGGEYFILNHLVTKYSSPPFSGWLTVDQFFYLYGGLFTTSGSSGGLWEVAFSLLTIATAIAVPRPVKLVAKALPRPVNPVVETRSPVTYEFKSIFGAVILGFGILVAILSDRMATLWFAALVVGGALVAILLRIRNTTIAGLKPLSVGLTKQEAWPPQKIKRSKS